MASPRPLGSSTVVKITRILMQKRWQNSVADQASNDSISKASAQPLAISVRTLPPFAGVVAGLLDPSPCSSADGENGIGETLVSEVELHLRSERLGMRLVSHIKIGYKTENALLFFRFELLGSGLLGRITHGNCSLHGQNAEFDVV